MPNNLINNFVNISLLLIFEYFFHFQVHLEADPNLYEHDDRKYSALQKSDIARLEIFSDLLSNQLGLIVQNRDYHTTNMYPNAYFLGRHEVNI